MPLSCRACTLVMEGTEDNKDMDTEPSTPVHSPEGVPQIRRKMHDIRIRLDEAIQKPAIFESKYSRLKEDRDNVRKSKLALELQEAGPSSASEDRMVVGWEELQDLKVVWSELSRIWEQIDEMKDTPWLSVHPRKLRQQMDLLLNQLKDLPARLRQYASYEYVKKLIQSFKKVNRLIVELTSGALKDRHWMTLCMQLRVSWVLSELTLRQVRAGMDDGNIKFLMLFVVNANVRPRPGFSLAPIF